MGLMLHSDQRSRYVGCLMIKDNFLQFSIKHILWLFIRIGSIHTMWVHIRIALSLSHPNEYPHHVFLQKYGKLLLDYYQTLTFKT